MPPTSIKEHVNYDEAIVQLKALGLTDPIDDEAAGIMCNMLSEVKIKTIAAEAKFSIPRGGYFEATYKAPSIERYDGDKEKPEKLRTFVHAIMNAFVRSRAQFTDEVAKVSFISDHLKGVALQWSERHTKLSIKDLSEASYVFDFDNPTMHLPFATANLYLKALIAEFKDVHWAARTYDDWVEMKQEPKQTSMDFINKFELASFELDVTDETKFQTFRRALNAYTTGIVLLSVGLSSSYDVWKEAALRVDQFRSKSEVGKLLGFNHSNSPKPSSKAETKETKTVSTTKTTFPPFHKKAETVKEPNLPDPDAMEIDAIKKLTKDDYLKYNNNGRKKITGRRKTLGLCTFCGSSDHTDHPKDQSKN